MGVNRDINNTQTITRDETHGGVDVRLNVDNNMVANPGEYVQAVREAPKNLKRAGRHVGNITHAHYLDITNDSEIALSRENPDGSSTFTEADTYIANNGDYTVGELSASREQSERAQAAYFAKRPLNGLPWLGPASHSEGSIDDKNNTEISHEHLFYEDEQGGNIGYSPEGLFVEKEPVNGYRITDQGYEDQLMREAVRITPVEKYCLVSNNCQDWADAVRDSYHRLQSQN